ncbi:MAG: CRISPR-associated protein Csb1 [Micromonosporaceae bacterium]|nr:CRISPR-associated protein Csb1 [Micromonosporaceae bacterium]
MSAATPAKRSVLIAELRPVMGQRFQPTGFPDLGAAEFESDQGRALLVESAQSMANRLEATTWDSAANDQVNELNGVPYVKVVDVAGEFLSSSRLEAHRLASAYVMEGKADGIRGETWLGERFGLQKGRPLDFRSVARACFALDPLSLVHGVFFARKAWPWQPRIARAVTSFIEAYDVRPVISGGVKRDGVHNEVDPGRGTAEGYGTVPHHRVEYTAGRIAAYFSIDHAQLRSYGLSEAATALLEALIDFEVGTLLDGGLRLRTACDFEVISVDGRRPVAAEAAKRIGDLVSECAGEFAGISTLAWTNEGRSKS